MSILQHAASPREAGIAVRAEVSPHFEDLGPRPSRVEILDHRGIARAYSVDVLSPEDPAITGAVLLTRQDTGETHTCSISLETGPDCTCGSFQFVKADQGKVCKHIANLLLTTDLLGADVAVDINDVVIGIRRSSSPAGTHLNDETPEPAPRPVDALARRQAAAFGIRLPVPQLRANLPEAAPALLPADLREASPCCDPASEPAPCAGCLDVPAEVAENVKSVHANGGILARSGLLDQPDWPVLTPDAGRLVAGMTFRGVRGSRYLFERDGALATLEPAGPPWPEPTLRAVDHVTDAGKVIAAEPTDRELLEHESRLLVLMTAERDQLQKEVEQFRAEVDVLRDGAKMLPAKSVTVTDMRHGVAFDGDPGPAKYATVADSGPSEADVAAMLADRPDPVEEAWWAGYRAACLTFGVGIGEGVAS